MDNLILCQGNNCEVYKLGGTEEKTTKDSKNDSIPEAKKFRT